MNENPTINVLRILIFNIIVIIRNVGSIASKKTTERRPVKTTETSELIRSAISLTSFFMLQKLVVTPFI